MPKNVKERNATQVELSAKINCKFDLLAMETDMGFYYLNFYAHCQKTHIYWCYIDEPGDMMRFNQTGIARKNPPHLNLALPPQVDALALRDLIARLDTSLFLESQKYFSQTDDAGESFINGTDDVKQWIHRLECEIENLPIAQQVMDCRNCKANDLQRLLEAKRLELTVETTEDEVRELARVLGNSAIADAGIYCWRLPWALLDLQKTMRGVDRGKETSEVAFLASLWTGYRETKIEDVIFHPNVAVNG